LDRRLIEPHSLGLRAARQLELPLVEQSFAKEHFTNVHQMPSSKLEGFLLGAFTDPSLARDARGLPPL
jgi:hypothetical protein